MKILVVGSIGKQGGNRRELLVNELTYAGFEVIVAGHSYEEKDWRDHYDEAQKIIEEAEAFFYENDFDVVVADLSAASDGRSHQLSIAKENLIPTFGFAPVAVASPFWLQVERFFTEIEPLVNALKSLKIKLELKRTAEEEKRREKEKNLFYRLWGGAWTSALALVLIGTAATFVGLGMIATGHNEDGLLWLPLGLIVITVMGLLAWERIRSDCKYRKQTQTAD